MFQNCYSGLAWLTRLISLVPTGLPVNWTRVIRLLQTT